MTKAAKLALIPLAVVPALVLAFVGGVLPAPVPTSDAPYSDAPWGHALEATARGDKDAALGAVRLYLAEVKSAGPSTRPLQFPGPAEVEAYWLNVHDAVALESALSRGGPPGVLARAVLPHAVSGRYVTLGGMERMLRASGDPRIYFVLTLLRPGDPALPEAPLRGQTLDGQLNAAARRYLDDPRHIRIEDGVLHLSALMGGEVREVAEQGPQQSLLQLVWTFLPLRCDDYPGCVTRTDLNHACGMTLDRCTVHVDADEREGR